MKAGCVPIYHAHPSVKAAFLEGAIWVDPEDYNFDAKATMDAALRMNREEVAVANTRWIQTNPQFKETSFENVYLQLADILKKKVAGKMSFPDRATRENLRDEY